MPLEFNRGGGSTDLIGEEESRMGLCHVTECGVCVGHVTQALRDVQTP